VDFAAYTGDDGRRAAEALGGRVGHYVMISSGQVYLVRDPPRAEGAPASREEDYDGPLQPRPAAAPDAEEWDYGAGKRACEDALAEAFARVRFPATRVRIPMVYGERDYQRRVEAYLWRLVDAGPLLLPDGGRARTRHVYGGEVARFLAEILGRPVTYGRAFNLAQREAPRLAEVVAMLAAEVGSRAEIVGVASEALVRAGLDPRQVSPFSTRWMSFVDPSRAERELGFEHAPLRECLGRVVAAFLAQPPSAPPAGYARRGDEVAFAHALRDE
jgi:nucleoside-diphosphate-sugar epimerase